MDANKKKRLEEHIKRWTDHWDRGEGEFYEALQHHTSWSLVEVLLWRILNSQLSWAERVAPVLDLQRKLMSEELEGEDWRDD